MLISDIGRARPGGDGGAAAERGGELWHLIVLVAAYGGLEAFFRPAAGGLIPALVPAAELQQANSLIGLAQNAGPVLGPALAGVLIVTLTPGAAVAVDAATFVVSAAFLVRLREPPRAAQPDGHAPDFLAELKGGFAEVRSRRWMLAFMPALSVYHWIALPCVLALGAVLADQELGGAGSWAVIVSASASARSPARRSGCAGSRAARCGGDARVPRRACQPAIIALAGSTAAIAAFEALAGIAVAIGFAQWETTLGRLIPGSALSRVTSLDWFTTVGLMPLGYALAGPVAEAVGLHETMVGASVISFALFARSARVPGRARALPQESIAS